MRYDPEASCKVGIQFYSLRRIILAVRNSPVNWCFGIGPTPSDFVGLH